MAGDGARRRAGWEFGGVCAGDGGMVAVAILVLSRVCTREVAIISSLLKY